ncbi:unnamed protein product [Polarella glacialis]|uniref:Uncharacterized protein n=1 Tax=Polarella glacialis TaxID=89957 RepID=A0A813ENS9_POLGL|nr:unnamed protein product [Polarella glacialis]
MVGRFLTSARIVDQIADVTMPLLSVVCVGEAGNTFHLGARPGYIENAASGTPPASAPRSRTREVCITICGCGSRCLLLAPRASLVAGSKLRKEPTHKTASPSV